MIANRVFLSLLLILACAAGVIAQEAQKPLRDSQDVPERPNLLRELQLSADQMDQIKRINAERKPQMEQALRRMREANRNLDMAIYSDSPDEADVRAKIDAFERAQAEVVRLRFASEFAVRNVLTPDQLFKFRELRRKFAEVRRQERRSDPGARFQRRLRRLGRPQGPPAN